jgi:hypothetical protein
MLRSKTGVFRQFDTLEVIVGDQNVFLELDFPLAPGHRQNHFCRAKAWSLGIGCGDMEPQRFDCLGRELPSGVPYAISHLCPSVPGLPSALFLTCKTSYSLRSLSSIPIKVGAHLPFSSRVDEEQAAVT